MIGSILALARNYCNGKISRIFKWLAIAYIEVFRNTPLLLWIFVCVVFCPCPKFLNHKMFGISTVEVRMLFKAAVALVLFTSSVLAEIIRGGLNSVAQGQFEAGSVSGFSYGADYAVHRVASGIQKHSAYIAESSGDHSERFFLSG